MLVTDSERKCGKLGYTFFVLLLLGVSILVSLSCTSEQDTDVVIGALLPLSGDVALYGVNAKEGIDLALDEVNQSGGIHGRTLRVVYEDSQADPKTGVAGFRRLISVHSVPAVIGGITSSVTLACAPIANEEQVVILSPAATSPDLSNAGPFVFRNWTSDAYEGQVISRFALGQRGIIKLAILYVNNDYGHGLVDVVTEYYSQNAATVVIAEPFEQGSTDFRTQITKIKNANPDGLYFVCYPEEAVILLNQIREMDLRVPLLATSAFQDEQILRLAGSAANAVVFPYPIEPNASDSTVTHFRSEFNRRYSKGPGIVGDTGYDALWMIVSALRNADNITGAAIRDGLLRLHDFHGASGIMTFDQNGDVQKTMEIRTVKDGQFAPYL